MPKTIDFLGYSFVADSVVIASMKFTQLASKAIVLCEHNCEITRNHDGTGPFIVT